MSILLLIMLYIVQPINEPQYQFKSTSSYIQNVPETSNTYNNVYSNKGPRKVSGLDGWAYWLWYGYSAGVPSDASNEDMYEYIDYIDNGGSLNYQDWYKGKNTPVGDGIPVMLIMIGLCIVGKVYPPDNIKRL